MKHPVLAFVTVAVLALFAEFPVFAASESWTGTTGNWTDATWAPDAVPPGATAGTTTNTDTATFNTPAGGTITVDANRNIQSITFDGSAGAFTLSGGPLVLTGGGNGIQLGTSGASFTGTNTTETISAPIILEGSANFTNNSTTTSDVLNIGAITNGANGTSTINLSGANTGANTISGAITNGANATNLSMSGPGNWILTSANNSFENTSINGGTLQLGNATALFNDGTSGGVNINVANGLTFSTGIGTFDVNGLNNSSNESLLDLGGNAITLQLGNLYQGDQRATYSYNGVLSDGGKGSNVTLYGYITETLGGNNTYTGTTTISGVNSFRSGPGTLATNLGTNGTPFGTGSVVMNNGTLAFDPSSGSPTAIAYTGASAAGSTFTYAGNDTVYLNKGGENSVTYTIGSGSGTVLQQSGTGTLFIQTAGSDLGSGENFVIATGSATPTVTNGIVSPTIVGLSGSYGNNGFIQTDFLTYNAGTGFGVTTSYTNYTASFSTATNEIENVNFTTPGTITQGTGNAYAMVINSSTYTPTISGTIGLGNGSGQAGLILESTQGNADFLDGGTINFGGAEGVVTVVGMGGAYGSINASFAGTGGVIIAGTQLGGYLGLSNGNTFSGGLTLNGETVRLGNNGMFGDLSNTVTFNGGGFQAGGVQVAGRSFILGIGGAQVNASNQMIILGGNFSGAGSLSTGGSETVLAGNSTYTGGTVISGVTAIASDANIGGASAPIIFGDDYGDVAVLSIMGTELTGFGSHPVTVIYNNQVSSGNAGQTAIGFDLQSATETFTVNQALNDANATFDKFGPGTLVLDAPLTTAANGNTINLVGGVMEVNEAAGGSITLANNLAFAGGTLDLVGGSSATTQTFGNITVTGQGFLNGSPQAGGGGSTLKVDSSAGGAMTVNLGGLAQGTVSGTTLDIIAAGGNSTITTTSAPDNSTGTGGNGIYGGRIVYTDSSGNVNWATSASGGPYVLSGYNNYVTLHNSSSNSDNVVITATDAGTIPSYGNVGTITFNSFKIANTAAGTLTLGGSANPVLLTSGGLLSTGMAAYTVGVAGDVLEAGNPTNPDLIIQQYGALGNANALTIAATIADSGTGSGGAVLSSTLTKAGPGTLILASTTGNTYTGQTYIVGGVLSVNADDELGSTSSNSPVNINGGTLQASSSFSSNRNIVLGSNGGTIDIINGSTLTLTNNLYAPANFNGGGDGSLTLTSSDNNALDTLIIAGNGNSFSEGVTINGGTLQTNNGLFGNGGDTLTFGNNTATVETLIMNNQSATIDELTAGSSNAIIENNDTSNSGVTLTDIQAGDTTYAGTFIDGTAVNTRAFNFVKAGGGTLTLTNANSSYTGTTEIDDGILNVASLAIETGTAGTANSSIGASSNAAGNLLFGGAANGSATLQYTGSTAQTTDRLFTLGDSNGTSATLDASGSVAAATVDFSNTGLIAISSAATNGADTHNLTLTGTNTGTVATMNTFAPQLVDGTQPTSLSKTGADSWAVTNNNTYSGGTTVSGGTLYANNATGSTGTGTVAVTSGGTLAGTGTIAATSSSPTFNAITVASGGNLAPGGVQTGTAANGSLTLNPAGVTGGGTILSASLNAQLTFAIGTGAPNLATTVSQLLVSGSVPNIMNFNVGGTAGQGGTSTEIAIDDLTNGKLKMAVNTSTEYVLIAGSDTTYEDDGISLAAANDLGSYNSVLGGYEILGGLSLLPPTGTTDYLGSELYLVGDNIVLAVPEPSTWVLMLGSFGLLVFIQRRKSSKTL